MNNEIILLEEKVKNLSAELLIKNNENTNKFIKDYYKHLMIALRVIQKQKEEILELQIKLHEVNEELMIKDIIRFCIK
jgi:hypothetical protein